MSQEVQQVKSAQYLGVYCQNCGEPIPVPARATRQIAAEGESEAAGRYLSTLLNLRCRACHKEYFYDVNEASQVEGTPRPFAHARHGHSVYHLHPGLARVAHN
jgi:hypothetical protein